MPIIKSAKKRMKQAEVRRKYNVAVKSGVKKQVKVVKTQITAGTIATSDELIKAVKEIDVAVRKGVLHKRTAARKKSRLTKAYNSVASKAYGTENPGKPGAKAKKPVVKKAAAKKATVKKVVAKKAAPKKAVAKKPAAKKPAKK